MSRFIRTTAAVLLLCGGSALYADPPSGEGWESLFNGKDLSGWKVPEAAEGSWTVKDGVIDCDPRAKKRGERSLWSKRTFKDFKLHVEWRIKRTAGTFAMPLVKPDGTYLRDESGDPVKIRRPNADSGIFVRGFPKSQVNIWRWPVGSGEVYGYRVDKSQPAEVRRGVTPIANADRPVGEWNTFVITMRGERLTVVLNGAKVIDSVRLPGVPERGPIGLQYHGGYDHDAGKYRAASSLMQFRNIYVKELQ